MNDQVTEPEAEATPVDAGEATNAEAKETLSVDSLLAEYDEATATSAAPVEPAAEVEPQTPAVASGTLDPAIEEVRAFMNEQRTKTVNEDVASAVSVVKEENEVLKGIPDRMIRGYLHDMANNDSRFLKAFQHRRTNPSGWANVLKATANEMSQEMSGQPDQQLTSNMSSLRASVNTSSPSSKEGPSDKDVSSMTDAEFDQHISSLGGSQGSSYVLP